MAVSLGLSLSEVVGVNDGLPAVTETIDVSTFNGNATFDIETIGGLAVSDYTHIQISCVDLVRSTTGSHMEMELRQQGGAFTDENYRWQGTSSVTRNPSTADFELTDATNANTHNCITFMSSVNQPCPTIIEHSNLNTAASFPAFHRGETLGAAVHDAIRFIANGGGGSETWVSGSVVVTGFRCAVGTLYSGTFSGQTEILIDLARNECIADCAFINTTLSAAGAIIISPGTGDTYVSTGIFESQLDAVGSSTNGGGFSGFTFTTGGSSATSQYGCGRIYNLQTAAPVCATTQNLADDGTDTNPQEIRSFINPGTTQYDQLRIHAGGTITLNSGTYYVQTYKPRRKILGAVDLTSYGSPEVEFTGLKKNDASLIVLASTDAVRASSDAGAFIQVGDGSGYKTNYLQLRVDEGSDVAATATVIGVTDDTAKTGAACLATIVGLPQETQTQMLLGMDMTSGLSAGVQATAGRRQTTAAENKFKYRNGGGGPDFNAGTLYAIGYSL